MNAKKTSIVALTWAYSLLHLCSGAWAWQAKINPGWASAVVLDHAGNILAAGATGNPGSGDHFTVAKFDGATGVELWRRVVDGSTVSNDAANAVAVDGAGNVVAAGNIADAFTVIKFDGLSGTELWRKEISGTAGGDNFAYKVAVDGAGNVVAAGVTENSGTDGDFTVVKFNGLTGSELWRRVINGPGNRRDSANALAVDGMGNVVAGGYTQNVATFGERMFTHADLTVVKFDGVSGAELWRTITGVLHDWDSADALAVDAAGNVIAAGYTDGLCWYWDECNSLFTVIKLNGTNGAELWRQQISGTRVLSVYDWANSVTVNAMGDVVAAGSTYNEGTFSDFTVIKFNGGSGAELWRQVILGVGDDIANAVAVDAAGDVVAAGGSIVGDPSDYFTVIKFDGASGQELWRQVLNGNGYNAAHAIAVDPAGNVVAAGSIGSDFTVVKLPAAGTLLNAMPSSITAGATVTATWSDIVSPMPGDWIGLYGPGASDSALVAASWVYVSCSRIKDSTGIESGSCPFQIPASLAAGTYELRLFANNSLLRRARSGPFTVQGAPPATLSATPSSVTAGANLTATWSGIMSPTPGDWIGLYTPGTSDSALMAGSWIYPTCSQVKGISGMASGSCAFQVPSSLPAGTYELRLFADHSLTRLATSASFTVQATPPATLSATPSSVMAGANLTVTWSGIVSPTAGDWIGLYMPGTSDSALVASSWIYPTCSQVKGSSGVAAGSCAFQIPTSVPAGSYELRLFANNSLVRLGRSNPVAVSADPTCQSCWDP